MSQNKRKQPKSYPDGRTKQSFGDETDINKILQRAQKTGTISHLAKHEAHYGDFANYDFLENQLMQRRGHEMFDDLPSELRREFDNSPAKFFAYVNDPANVDRLEQLLPQLAEPGRQLIDVSGKSAPADASPPVAGETAPPGPPVSPGNENPAAGNIEAPATPTGD